MLFVSLITIQITKQLINSASDAEALLLAVCVPDACFPSDFFGKLGDDTSCQIKGESKKLDASDIACMYVI